MRLPRATLRREVAGLLVATSLWLPAVAWALVPSDEVFVSADEAYAAAESGALLWDARTGAEYTAGHARGAVNAEWTVFSDPDEQGRLHPSDAVLGERIGALGASPTRPIYVIGAWAEAWGEEGRIFWMLEFVGHDDVHIVEGGHRAWARAGLPVVAGPAPTVAPATFDVARRPALEATLDEVAAGGATFIDTRARGEFDGATPYGSVRGGHIPGARWLHWDAVITSEGLASETALAALFPESGPLVPYCTGGIRSGFVYAVLRSMGRDEVANFAGSWWEYAKSDLPAE